MYKGQRKLQTGDLLLSIDGHQLSSLGPLGVARILEDVPFRAVPIFVEPKGKTSQVRPFGEGVLTNGTVELAPTYSPNELQQKDEGAPQFSLVHLQGQRRTSPMYKGSWVLLNFWGTWCSGCHEELPALNYLSEKHGARITVLGIDINDEIGTLRKFLSQNPLSYPVLQGIILTWRRG